MKAAFFYIDTTHVFCVFRYGLVSRDFTYIFQGPFNNMV